MSRISNAFLSHDTPSARRRPTWAVRLGAGLVVVGLVLAFGAERPAGAEEGDDWSAPSTAPRKAPPKELLPAPIVRDPRTGRTRSGVHLPALPRARPAGAPQGGHGVGFAPLEGEGTKGPFSKGGVYSPRRIRTTAPVPSGVPGHDPGLPRAEGSVIQGGMPAPRLGGGPTPPAPRNKVPTDPRPGVASTFPQPNTARAFPTPAPNESGGFPALDSDSGSFPAPNTGAGNEIPPPAMNAPEIELPVGPELDTQNPGVVLTPEPLPGPAAPSNARALVERIDKVHNISVPGGHRAVRLDVVFSVEGLAGQSVYLLVDFYDRRSGRRIRSMLPDFAGTDGAVLVQTEPARIGVNQGRFQGSAWTPYGAFPAPSQGTSYAIEARVRVMNGRTALTESRTTFTVYGPGAPQLSRLRR